MALQEVQKVWKCAQCTLHNDENHIKCIVCSYQRSNDDIPFYSNPSPHAQHAHAPHKYGCVEFLTAHRIKQQIPDAYNDFLGIHGKIPMQLYIFGKHDVEDIKTPFAQQLAPYEGRISYGITCNFLLDMDMNQNFNRFKASIDDQFQAMNLKNHLRLGRDIIIPCGSTSQSLDPNEFCQCVEDDGLKSKYIEYIERKIKENAQFDVIQKVSRINQPVQRRNHDEDQKAKPRAHAKSDAAARRPRRAPNPMLLAAIQSGAKLNKVVKSSDDRKKVKGARAGGMLDISGVALKPTVRRDRSQSCNAKSPSIDFRSVLKKKSPQKTGSEPNCDGNYKTKTASWMNKKLRKVDTTDTAHEKRHIIAAKKAVGSKKEERKEKAQEKGNDGCGDELISTDSEPQLIAPPKPPVDVLPQCVDCGEETHEGRVYEGNNEFYCNDCWMQYEYAEEQHTEVTHAVVGKPSPQKQNKPREPPTPPSQKQVNMNKKQLFSDIRKRPKLKKIASEPNVRRKPMHVMNKQRSALGAALFDKIIERRELVAELSSDSGSDWDLSSQ